MARNILRLFSLLYYLARSWVLEENGVVRKGCPLPCLGVECLGDSWLAGILFGPTESSGIIGKGDLQSTLLEGHGTAPPDLDLSAINGKSFVSPFSQPGVAVYLSGPLKCALLTLKMLFLILEKSMLRKTPQLEKTMSKKTKSTSFSASRKKTPVSVWNDREASNRVDKSGLSPALCQVPREAWGSKNKQASHAF